MKLNNEAPNKTPPTADPQPSRNSRRYKTRDLVVQFALELAPKQGIQSRRELTPEEWAIVKPRTCRIMDYLLSRWTPEHRQGGAA